MRLSVIATAICLSIVGISTAQDAEAAIRRPTHIAAQGLAAALHLLAKERDVQVVYRSELVRDQRTSGAAGDLTFDEALTQLLSGTGLTYRYLDDKAITIMPVNTATGSATTSSLTSEQSGTTDPASPRARAGGQGGADASDDPSKKSFWDRFRLAQADQGTSSGSTPVEKQKQQASKEKPVQLEEVLVTAQKREERLQDVPVPVSVIDPQPLLETDQVRLQEYYSQIPGLSMAPYSQSISAMSLRGITTGEGGNPTVGIIIDDVPFGRFFGSVVAPDIDPNDLARIEVLRGPQGTLYGASSLGGLLKYVTADPSTEVLSGGFQGGTSSVYNGAAHGYSLRGSVNVPLGNTLAIRASAFTREDPGYIDNPVLGIDGVNKTVGYGGMLAVLWQPSERVSLKLNALYQKAKADGSNDVDMATLGYVGPALGSLQQNYIPGIGGYDAQTQFYSAKLAFKLGAFDLTSLTGYNVTRNSNSVDGTFAYGPITQQYFGVSGSPIFTYDRDEDFTQEVRLFGPVTAHIDWLLGLFYAHQYSPTYQTFAAENPTSGATVGWWYTDNSFPTTYSEDALYTDLTFHITDRLDIQIGGRESHITESSSEVDVGNNYTTVFLGLPSPVIVPEVSTRANSFTYLLTPRFKVSPDLMVYARLASGYRAGGPNSVLDVLAGYSPDKTYDYEVGAKGDFLNHSVSVDGSVYYIDWQDIQLKLLDQNQQSYVANAGAAKSEGVELSVKSTPVAGLAIRAWGTWDDAVLTKGFPASSTRYGVPGDRLPYSSRFSGNFSLNDEFPLPRAVTGFFGGTLSYVGDRVGEFRPHPQRQLYPSYTRTDLRAGLKYRSWTTTLFVNNCADVRGELAGGRGYVPPFGLQYIQPRTVGLSLSKSF